MRSRRYLHNVIDLLCLLSRDCRLIRASAVIGMNPVLISLTKRSSTLDSAATKTVAQYCTEYYSTMPVSQPVVAWAWPHQKTCLASCRKGQIAVLVLVAAE